jgi:FkbM family methyltransferase
VLTIKICSFAAMKQDNLIFDIGMHKGEDTAYYLRQGFNVVAVEANPILAEFCKKKFKTAINDNRLTIVNAGISDREGDLPFYVNHYCSEWSSFDREIGTRNDTKHEVINIQCIRTSSLFAKYGIPHYMKVDIEGNDIFCINDISLSGDKPKYVSCESNDVSWLDALYKLGYTKFKLINQANGFKPLNSALEKRKYYILYRKGKHAIQHKLRNIIPQKYKGGSSGPFGEQSKGKWKSYEEVRKEYSEYMQGDLKTPVNQISWCDFHASL